MKRIITGATGMVASAVLRQWVTSGHKVLAVGRSRGRIAALYGAQVRALEWEDLAALSGDETKDVDVVLNLAGASIAEKRWTPQRKEEILNSRVDATRRAAEFCARHGLTLMNASAVGIYGMHKAFGRGLDEAAPAASASNDFLAMVCRKWEEAAAPARAKGCRVVHLRFGVILNAEEGAFPKMLLPFKLFMGGPLGSGNQPVAWVSLRDAVKAIDFLCSRPDIAGPVNVVSPGCLTQKELARAIGKAVHRSGRVPTPGFILKIVLGEMAGALLLNGQRVLPNILLESGFKFEHKYIDDFLKSLKMKI